jgi:hypothetical protein
MAVLARSRSLALDLALEGAVPSIAFVSLATSEDMGLPSKQEGFSTVAARRLLGWLSSLAMKVIAVVVGLG